MQDKLILARAIRKCADCLAAFIHHFQALSEKLVHFKSALHLSTCVMQQVSQSGNSSAYTVSW